MINTDHPALTEPAAIAVQGGVDLLLPPATPRDVLDVFVASCNLGACECDTAFVAKIHSVELFEEAGCLRVHIAGDISPAEVLAEMVASAPQLSQPPA